MAVPPAGAQCWLRLANGGLAGLRTEHLGIKMMVKRLERSPAPSNQKAAEIHEFFKKWEGGLRNEITQLAHF